MKWLESLKKTIISTQTEVITVCDREADIHDFFELAHNLNSAILVRARHNRNVNKKFMHTRNKQKLWSFIQGLSCVDALGNPLKFTLTPGQRNEITQAQVLTESIYNSTVVADKGYDSNAFITSLEGKGCTVTKTE